MSTEKYLNLITSQHKVQPKFMAWLGSTLNMLDDIMEVTESIPSAFDIDNAVGVQLDLIGSILGRSRVLSFQPSGGTSPILNDANYRISLKAKIAQNQWDGTLPKIYEIWNSIFPDVKLVMIDNQDMTVSAVVSGLLDPVATELVVGGHIIPKPMGVKLNIIESIEVSESSYIGMIVTEMDYITLTLP
ncbi:DUF2612 domain-containing protein [Paenibacillus sp. 2RAB27]|uniref:DUF2612 domain-containing protein n=1 Tax=Paenibacillus sp. 2RAB27 TaxID=3232991 RepID=UPI003F97C646